MTESRKGLVSDWWISRYGGWFLGCFALLLLFAGTPTIPLLDRDEPRFSQATREMMERSDGVVPYFNDEYRFDKPVLTYWLMRLPYQAVGVTEWTARLHTVIAGILLVLGVFYGGRKLFGQQAGFWAALALLTSLQVMIHGRIAVADMPLILCIAVSHWSLWRILTHEKESPLPLGPFWWLYGSIGVGFLAKGPLAIAVPLLTLWLYRFVFHRQPLAWGRLQPIRGTLVILAIVAPWGIAALMQTHGLFWKEGMEYHVVERGMDVFNERKFIPGFYFVTMWISLFPWSPWIVAWASLHFRKMDREAAFLLAWFIGPFIIFTFYATQLPHYILPGFPAFFLLLFRHGELPSLAGGWSLWTWRVLQGLFAAAGVGMVILGCWVYFSFGEMRAMGGVFLAIGVLCLAAQCVAWSCLRKTAAGCLLALAVLVLGWWGLGAAMRENSVVIRMSPELSKAMADPKCWSVGFLEPSLVFYSNQKWDLFGSEESLTVELRGRGQSGPTLLVRQLGEIKLDRQLVASFSTAPVSEETPVSTASETDLLTSLLERLGYEKTVYRGMNYARFTWVEIELWKRASTP